MRRQEDRKGGAAVQRWRWFYVVLIGAIVALLSMVVNLGIAALNSVRVKTTERLINRPGMRPGSLPALVFHQMHSAGLSRDRSRSLPWNALSRCRAAVTRCH